MVDLRQNQSGKFTAIMSALVYLSICLYVASVSMFSAVSYFSSDSAAASKSETAIEQHPYNYRLWLLNGAAYSQNHDFPNALAAYQRSIELAPNYAEPKWKTGLLFLKEKNYETAFDYLNQAANKDTDLFPELFNIAATTFSDDRQIDVAIRPESVTLKETAAEYFIDRKISSEKTAGFLTGDEIPANDKEHFVNRLMDTGNFLLAYKVWVSQAENKDEIASAGRNLLLNGGFENEIDPSNKGFDWQINQDVLNVRIGVTDGVAAKDQRAIQLVFNGNSDPNIPIISQIVIVQPEQRYRLTFSARVEELVTGGLPVVAVKDAASNDVIAISSPLQQSKERWNALTVEFRTAARTNAIVIIVNRLGCNSSPCPVFGKITLDDFVLKPV